MPAHHTGHARAQTFLGKAAPAHPESASALQTATFTIAISVGAMVGGMLVSFLGPASVYVYAAAATLTAALLVRAIKSPNSEAEDGANAA